MGGQLRWPHQRVVMQGLSAESCRHGLQNLHISDMRGKHSDTGPPLMTR